MHAFKVTFIHFFQREHEGALLESQVIGIELAQMNSMAMNNIPVTSVTFFINLVRVVSQEKVFENV